MQCRWILLLLSLSACFDNNAAGFPPPGDSGGACLLFDANDDVITCDFYMGIDYTPHAVEVICADDGREYQEGACPAEARVGSCRVYGGTTSELKSTYYVSGYDESSARTACTEQLGSFIEESTR